MLGDVPQILKSYLIISIVVAIVTVIVIVIVLIIVVVIVVIIFVIIIIIASIIVSISIVIVIIVNISIVIVIVSIVIVLLLLLITTMVKNCRNANMTQMKGGLSGHDCRVVHLKPKPCNTPERAPTTRALLGLMIGIRV